MPAVFYGFLMDMEPDAGYVIGRLWIYGGSRDCMILYGWILKSMF